MTRTHTYTCIYVCSNDNIIAIVNGHSNSNSTNNNDRSGGSGSSSSSTKSVCDLRVNEACDLTRKRKR